MVPDTKCKTCGSQFESEFEGQACPLCGSRNTSDLSAQHAWGPTGCSCGQDVVVCQGCGRDVCGDVAVWHDRVNYGNRIAPGNVGPCCFAKYGLGHGGGR